MVMVMAIAMVTDMTTHMLTGMVMVTVMPRGMANVCIVEAMSI
jgi:hypothetical protein